MISVTKTSDRTELVLRICAALGGAVPLDVLYAAMPDVQESAVRRLLSGLSADNVLVPAFLKGTHGKVWLDAAGRRQWLRPGPNGLLPARVVPGRTFVHDRLAALLVGGLGHEYGMTFDRELLVNKCDRKPDGICWIGEHYALIVEVERMRGRNVHVWDDGRQMGLIKSGLLTGMLEILRLQQRRNRDEPLRESLVCLPARFVRKLVDQLAPKVQELGSRQCGWWSVTLEDPEADLVWHPVRGGERPNIAGLRTIRARLRSARPSRPPPQCRMLPHDLQAIFDKGKAADESKKPTPSPSRGSLRLDLQDILDRAKEAQYGNKS